MLVDQELQILRSLGKEGNAAADKIHALRVELSLAREVNLSVVRRQQSEIDALNVEIKLLNDLVNSAERTINRSYDDEQRHSADLRASSGCPDGHGAFGYVG